MTQGRVSVFSSENEANIPVYPLDVFVATEEGTAQLRGGATRLPADALALLVLLDGKANVGDLEARLPQLPSEGLRGLLRTLLAAGFARAATISETDGLDFSAFFNAAAGTDEPSLGAQASASREAEAGTPRLEREGYYVSIARQAVKPVVAGGSLSILVVEDDPDVTALLKRLLEREGFGFASAASRDEVLARLRTPPMPDLVILDVILPDVNGFDVLQRMKAHAALKAVPVIMLTADARRESVTRGLLAGADGYLTKPFDGAALVAGIRAVLGLAAPTAPS
jgi:CheY-like chemotaxis protein